jgi:uncharacterized lipoprotein YddW (UPF0748 family)
MKKLIFIVIPLILLACQPATQKQETQKFVFGYNEPVRGVWLTNVASEALFTPENVAEAVRIVSRTGHQHHLCGNLEQGHDHVSLAES